MHAMQLSTIDVNLIVALRALLETGNVTKAGRRIGLSPSAMSHALGRLRTLLDDPLLVRAGRKLAPTPRALALAAPVAQALESLEKALAPQTSLEPHTLERSFRIETTDHVQFVLLRALDALLRKESPHVNVYLQSLKPETFTRLREGAIDLAISVYDEIDPDLEREALFEDRLVAVVRRKHPALEKRMTLARFAALDHLLVAPNGSPTGLVDRLLAEHGLQRRVARTSSTFLDIAFLVAETDYVVSLPQTVAAPLLDRLRLATVAMPLPLPSFTHSIVWHRRHTTDPAHAWFRGRLSHVARAGLRS
jgi:DNA-binding transcriptional LysR family regulator